MKTAAQFPLISVEIEREEIEETSFVFPVRVPDPAWHYVDDEGHGHFWGGVKGDQLPTLNRVVTGTHWVGDEYDGVEVEDYEWRCRVCTDVIEPGMKNETPKPVFGPTTVTVTINGEVFRVTEDEYARSVDAWKKSLEEITGRM